MIVQNDRRRDLYHRAIIGRAKMFQFTGRYEDAMGDYRRLKKIARDPRQQFEYYQGISYVLERMGRFRPAIALVERAIRLSRRHRDIFNDNRLMNTKVNLLIHKGDNAGALRLAYSLLRKMNRGGGAVKSAWARDQGERASLLKNIAFAYYAMEKYDQALDYYYQARKYNLRAKNLEGVSIADNNLTLIYWKMGDYAKALERGRESLAVREKIGHVYGISSSLNNLGLINDEMGNYQEALGYYEKAREIFQRLNNIYGLTIALTNIGSIYHEILGDLKQAYPYYHKSYQYSRRTGDPTSEAEGLLAMMTMQWRMGDRRAFTRSLRVLNRLMSGIKSVELSSVFVLAQIRHRIWQNDRTGVDAKADELFALLKRAKNDLLTMESVASFIDMIYQSHLTGFLDKCAPAAGDMAKKLPSIESPLRRSKVLMALVKYHLLFDDRARAGQYLRMLEDTVRRYGIMAEAEEIERLRVKVKS